MSRDAFWVQWALATQQHGGMVTVNSRYRQDAVFPIMTLKHRGARVVPMGVFVALGVLVAGGHQVGAIGEVYIAKC